jgi:hypothetical protein
MRQEFDEREMEVIGTIQGNPYSPPLNVCRTPVSLREGALAALSGKPYWQIVGTALEQRIFSPRVVPDNVARAFVIEKTPFDPEQGGGKDMFGVKWEYVPVAGGSMVRPGCSVTDDANELSDKLVWPDIESWDWAGSATENKEFLRPDRFNQCWFFNGWFERLISLMDFEDAAVAMIDNGQKDAVKAFFDKLSDLYIAIFDKYIRTFPEIDGFCIHDDWGSQRETFFSPETAAEMIVPYMRRVTDRLHDCGKYCELHSCGQLFKQIPNIIAAGWDTWTGQDMNDTAAIYDLYGDRLLVGVLPETYDPLIANEEEQRAAARRYAERFCRPDKPSCLNFYAGPVLTPVFLEELYRQSRKCYCPKKGEYAEG